MFDERKQHELENKSHVRGILSKEFFSSEQEELERKRREMKAILDQQVEEKRRQKEKERYQLDQKLQQEDERIRDYHAKVNERERKMSYPQPNNNRNGSGVYGSSGVYESKVSFAEKGGANRQRVQSRNYIHPDLGDIPVMPVMQSSDKVGTIAHISQSRHQKNSSPPARNSHQSSAGNIPLLELSQDQLKKQQKKRLKTKNPTRRESKEKQKSKERQEREERESFRQRRNTEESLPGSRHHTEFKQVFGDINEEIQEQNKQLRKELKKNQEAISLLIGAVRSNTKLDKFRIQAEKILHGGQSSIGVINGQSRATQKPVSRGGAERQLMLPHLKVKHQSIMHDYMFGSARRAHAIKMKSMK